MVNRCLQIAGTVGSGGGCRCTPLVARDRLGLELSSVADTGAELSIAVGIGLAELALHLAWLTA